MRQAAVWYSHLSLIPGKHEGERERHSKCNRWFFRFNDKECSGPMTIEAVVYNIWQSGNPNLQHHRSFEGYCENVPQGKVSVELWIGRCPGEPLGVAYIAWSSVSRIMLESRPDHSYQYCTAHHALRIDNQLSERAFRDKYWFSVGARGKKLL